MLYFRWKSALYAGHSSSSVRYATYACKLSAGGARRVPCDGSITGSGTVLACSAAPATCTEGAGRIPDAANAAWIAAESLGEFAVDARGEGGRGARAPAVTGGGGAAAFSSHWSTGAPGVGGADSTSASSSTTESDAPAAGDPSRASSLAR